ncbi:MAG: FAD-binding oxidoreductase [Deltaproteobacteria bacterium]|nr:FAD-binding oxidoreductase [Deltaproteobacteria bacterium]
MVGKKALAGIVGEENVVTDRNILDAFAVDKSYGEGTPPAFLVKPHSTEEVQAVINLAKSEGFPLIPVSSGAPRDHEDTVPACADSVIVDLSDMKKIVRLDRRNKVALIEPGVTFGELHAAAKAAGLRVLMPLLPRMNKSVLASCLEREPFTIPKYQWDTTDPLMCMELVFGSGDIYRTGSAAGPGSLEAQWETGAAQKNPLGPGQWDPLRLVQGAQGTMGIVTWGSVKLELLPREEKCFLAAAEKMDELIEFSYLIQKFKLVDVCFIMNAVDLASLRMDVVGKFPPWVLVYSISGYEYFPGERIDYIEHDIEEMAHATGVLPISGVAGVSAGDIVGAATLPCEGIYWKDRLRGDCRDIFFITTLDRVPRFLDAMAGEAKAHGFPEGSLGIYIQPIQQGRNCHLEFNLMYDGRNADEAGRVRALYETASVRCADMGAFFSRPYGAWAALAYRKDQPTVKALKMVKHMLDPKGIMNPGKLSLGTEV